MSSMLDFDKYNLDELEEFESDIQKALQKKKKLKTREEDVIIPLANYTNIEDKRIWFDKAYRLAIDYLGELKDNKNIDADYAYELVMETLNINRTSDLWNFLNDLNS